MTVSRRQFLGTTAATAGLAAFSASAAESGDLREIGRTPHTKFAVNVEMWWTKLPFLERIRKTAELGFPAVEFWPWNNKDIEATASLCRDLGVAVAQFTAWGFKPGLNEPKNHKQFVQAVKDGCRVAKQLDCRLMTVVAGDDVHADHRGGSLRSPARRDAVGTDRILTACRPSGSQRARNGRGPLQPCPPGSGRPGLPRLRRAGVPAEGGRSRGGAAGGGGGCMVSRVDSPELRVESKIPSRDRHV